ncbi:competence protein CoiA family protein [Desulfobacula sp.]|uniref:competence protein CoiA family protein n=1 Tax=Desulfobacula sp. TaxID=2593537 RepID=UPI0027153C41|nr:competence protein CoiA family protein [Desulfobacula sp.]
MPLRAIIDGKTVQSFDFTEDEWNSLKNKRSELDVKMICCKNKGILKTSSLGTFFFAHHRRNGCKSPSESKEHLLAKFIVAKAAKMSGWCVFTEYKNETLDGEAWQADVYAKKDSMQIAFEIQLSPQTNKEYDRRQKKYKTSDVRCAWFSKYKKNKDYFFEDDDYNLPKFPIEYSSKNNSFIVKSFDVELSNFIEGMLAKKLKMFGRGKTIVSAGLIITDDICWKCQKKISVVSGIAYIDKNYESNGFGIIGKDSEFLHFYEISSTTLLQIVSNKIRQNYKIGPLKERYSHTGENSYFSNGCYFCNALIGDRFISMNSLELLDNESMPSPKICYDLEIGKDLPKIQPYWTYNGEKKRVL